MRLRLAAAGLLAALAGEARGQADDFLGLREAGQFQPEGDVFLELGEYSRLQLQVQPTFIPSESYSDMTVAAFVSWHVVQFLEELITPDKAKGRYLELRLGSQYTATMEPGTAGSSQTFVLLADLTPRYSLPWSILVTDRNRVEARWKHETSTSHSYRYRNRLQLERDFDVHPVSLTPFANVEFIWDSASAMWIQFRAQAGLQLGVDWFARGQVIELNYMAIAYLQPSRSYTPVVGLVLYTYF